MSLGKIVRAAAAGILAALMCGCSIRFGTNIEPKISALAASPKDQSAADKLGVTYGEFKNDYAYFLESSGISDDSAEAVAEVCKQRRSIIINVLMFEKAVAAKAPEYGADKLDEDEQKVLDNRYEAYINSRIAAFEAKITEEGLSDEEKHKRAEEEFDKFLEDCGLSRGYIYEKQKGYVMAVKLIDILSGEDLRAEAESAYEEYASLVKELYEQNPLAYEQGNYTDYYIPDGSRYIRHILLGFDEETKNKISSLRSEGKEAEADELCETKKEELADKIKEVEDKIDAGEDFKQLLLEYSADAFGSSMNLDGYLVVPGGQSYMKNFQSASFIPKKIGERTVCVTDAGVHIIIYNGDAKVSAEAREATIETMLESRKQESFSKTAQGWVDDCGYTINYEMLKIDDPAKSE